MFLNYAEHSKGYKVLNLESGKLEVSRSLIIDEREGGGYCEEWTTKYYENEMHQQQIIDREPDAFEVPVSQNEKSDEEILSLWMWPNTKMRRHLLQGISPQQSSH